MTVLHDKIAVITGAKGGLGSFVTEAFLAQGARVIGVSRSIKDSDFANPGFSAIAAELSSSHTARALMETALAKFGRIDIAVHLMGGFAGGQNIAETDDATLEKMLDMNLRSAFYFFRAALPHLRKAGHGRLIAIGSQAAVQPAPGAGVYALSKAALVSLVQTIAAENRDTGITANIVLPGTMDTPANRAAMPSADFSKWAQPSRVASLITWLASEDGADTSGAAIPVYGSGP
jgi:NAD(P)-dependent dehydrogenase (short-subunit alcohol dehydrogenase family)